jgi:hypothetical protein
LQPAAKASAFIFLAGVALVVLFGFFPGIAQAPGREGPAADADRDRDRDDVDRCGNAASDEDRRRRGAEDRDLARRRGRCDRHLRPGMAGRQLHRREQGRDRSCHR